MQRYWIIRWNRWFLLLSYYFCFFSPIIILLLLPLFTDFSVTLPSNSKNQERMNSNSKLKIVWMVCGVAIVLLFCTQAYWLHLQCQYSLDQQVEQFKKDCDEVLAQDLKNRKKLQENSSTKGRRDTVMLKIESEYDMKKGCSRTTLSFWNNHRFLCPFEWSWSYGWWCLSHHQQISG